MRYIVCIAYAGLCAFSASTATADDFQTECYHRQYSAEHLSRNPGQNVKEVTVQFRTQDVEGAYSEIVSISVADVRSLIADTAAMREIGAVDRWYENTLVCQVFPPHASDPEWYQEGAMTCGVECDGGYFQIASQTEDELIIRTDGIRLRDGDMCGGRIRMRDEGDGPTTYKLTAAPVSVCSPDEGGSSG